MNEYEKARKDWLEESLPLTERRAAGERMDREAIREKERRFSRCVSIGQRLRDAEDAKW